MSNDILAYLVTGLGILLCLSLIMIIFLGKRIAGAADGPQEIEFKGLRAKTNVVVMFLMVSLFPAVFPLYLVHLDRAASPQSDVDMYETWTVRGQIVADNADESLVQIQPEPTKVNINADGSFLAKIPVSRSATGKRNFPILVIDNPTHRRENLDLDGAKQANAFGARDFAVAFHDDTKSVNLGKPITLVLKKTDPRLGAVAGGNSQ